MRRQNNSIRYRASNDPRQRQLTPSHVVEAVREALGSIELDPCTEPENPTGAANFFTENGLEKEWDAATIFVNPPYGKAKDPWCDKCVRAAKSGAKVALLIPSHTETATSQRMLETCDNVLFLNGRLTFSLVRDNGRLETASHGSALYFFGDNLVTGHLSVLGVLK